MKNELSIEINFKNFGFYARAVSNLRTFLSIEYYTPQPQQIRWVLTSGKLFIYTV